MECFLEILSLPKGGNDPQDFEDAFYPPLGEEQLKGRFRAAIADGASSGILSGKWAQVLTEAIYTFDGSIYDLHTIIEIASLKWGEWLQGYLNNREQRNMPIRWYEEPGLKTGAFATLLGLEINEGDGVNEWHAVAIGDSCLFQIRQGQLVKCFPIIQSKAFNNNPILLCSVATSNSELRKKSEITNGEWQKDDVFYLMTDALAQWFLNAFESGQQPWIELNDFNKENQKQTFIEFIDGLRSNRYMRNDDVSLIRISMI